ncbi:MAG: GtrA family protein [Clostridiales bacterium]|nr:GtrA family protein [Clostridiales bacterium]
MSKTKDKLNTFIAAHPTLCEFARFIIVGGLATVVDMFVMGVVLYAFDPSLYPAFYNVWYGGLSPSTAATVVGTCCGFLSGLIINYVLSVLFVFINKGKSKSVFGFAVFAGLSAIGLGIHTGGMYIGYTLLGINEWIVKIFLTVVVLIYNYISKRLVLFIPARNANAQNSDGTQDSGDTQDASEAQNQEQGEKL